MTVFDEGTCPEPERLVDFLEGRLLPEVSSAFEQHLAGCASCQAAVAAGVSDEDVQPLDEPREGLVVAERYALTSRLEGNDGQEHWQARDTGTGETVAVRLLPPSSRAAAHALRLLHDARMLTGLRHPHLSPVLDAGLHEGRPFVVSAWQEEVALPAWLAEKKRSSAEVSRLFIDAALALWAAHQAGLVHRYLRPSSLRVDAAGKVRLSGFGLAPLPTDVAEEAPGVMPSTVALRSLGESGGETGSVSYRAPEQLEGKEATALSDQYALSAVFYEALTGMRPFSASGRAELLEKMRSGRVLFPDTPRLPAGVKRLLVRGLQLSPERRHPDLRAWVVALEDTLRATRRTLRVAALAVGLAVLATVGVGLWQLQRQRACEAGDSELSKRFGPRELATLKAAWDGAGAADEGGWKRVKARLDGFGQAWSRVYGETCRATRAARTQPESRLEVQWACLHRQAEELRAVAELVGARKERVRVLAPDALAELPSPGTCAGVSRDEGGHPGAVRLHALRSVGDFAEAKSEAEATLEASRKANDRRLEAEALHTLAVATFHLEPTAPAHEGFRRAAALGDELGMDELRARALVDWAFVTGAREGRFGEAHLLLDAAESAVRRLGRVQPPRDELLYTRATLLFHEGRREEALPLFEESLASMQALGHERHPKYVGALRGLGRTLLHLQRASAAAEQYRRAAEKAEALLGPAHPLTLQAQSDLGTAYAEAGKLQSALATLERALQTSAASADGVAPSGLLQRGQLAALKGHLGQLEPAMAELDAVRERLSEKRVGPVALVPTQRALAELAAFRGEARRAEGELRLFLGDLLSVRGASHPDIARVGCTLGHVQLMRGDVAGGLRTFEDALEALEAQARTDADSWCLHAGIVLSRVNLARGDIEPHASIVLERTVTADTSAAKRNRAEVLYAKARLAYIRDEEDTGRGLVADALKELDGLEGVRLEAVRRVIRNLPVQVERGELALEEIAPEPSVASAKKSVKKKRWGRRVAREDAERVDEEDDASSEDESEE